MATLLNEATDNWSFDKLIQPLSNQESLQQLIAYLSGKHASNQHDHIDPIALSRILIALKFVGSKKKLANALKPFIDELMSLCHSITAALKQNDLSKSSPWLWMEKIFVFMDEKGNYSDIDPLALSNKLSQTVALSEQNSRNSELPQYLFPEWSFCTRRGIETFSNHFASSIDCLENADCSSSDDDDDDIDADLHNLFEESPKEKTEKKEEKMRDEELKLASRTFTNVKFLTFCRPKVPETHSSKGANVKSVRKRQKVSANCFVPIGLNESARKRKFCAINDKVSRMMSAKNEKKNGIKLLSIQQKRQMREDSDRREQERRYLLEQSRLA